MSKQIENACTIVYTVPKIAGIILQHFNLQYGHLNTPSMENLMTVFDLHLTEFRCFGEKTECLVESICNCLERYDVSITTDRFVSIRVQFVKDYNVERIPVQKGLEYMPKNAIAGLQDETDWNIFLSVEGHSWREGINENGDGGRVGSTEEKFYKRVMKYVKYQKNSNGNPLWHLSKDAYFYVHVMK